MQKFESFLLENEERREHIDYLHQRYGLLPSFWDRWDFIKRREGLWIFPTGSFSKGRELATALSEESAGLRLFSGTKFPYKVTHQFGLFCHPLVTKGYITLDESSALALLKRGPSLNIESSQTRAGYYLAYYCHEFIGVLLLTKRGEWHSQVPKSLRAQLSDNLKLLC